MQQNFAEKIKMMTTFNLPVFLVIAIVVSMFGSAANAESSNLPTRSSPVPATTNRVPHIQIGVKPNPEISASLLHQVSKMAGVEIRETVISLPGAKGFWINESVTITRPSVIVGGREFAHMHPDGSLHASLPPELAKKSCEKRMGNASSLGKSKTRLGRFCHDLHTWFQ